MMSDEHGPALHDKRTRGQALSEQEQIELEHWYARLDRDESAILGRMTPSPNLAELEGQVATAIAQLHNVTQRIQTLTADNTTVRQEIAELQQQLAQKSATQPA